MKLIFLLTFFYTLSFSFVATATKGINILDDLYKAISFSKKLTVKKSAFIDDLLKNSNKYTDFTGLSHKQRIDVLIEIASEKNIIKKSKKLFYANKFNQLENGDKFLLEAIKNNKNLNLIIKTSKKYMPLSLFEKAIIKASKQVYFENKAVYQRNNIFYSSSSNIRLMRSGKAPLDKNGKPIELHHLKQKDKGYIVELTKKEHTENSNILHRYKGKGESEIDRKKFKKWKEKYWKNRAEEIYLSKL